MRGTTWFSDSRMPMRWIARSTPTRSTRESKRKRTITERRMRSTSFAATSAKTRRMIASRTRGVHAIKESSTPR